VSSPSLLQFVFEILLLTVTITLIIDIFSWKLANNRLLLRRETFTAISVFYALLFRARSRCIPILSIPWIVNVCDRPTDRRWARPTVLSVRQKDDVKGSATAAATLQPLLKCSKKLFSRLLTNDNHVLQQYLTDRTSTQYNIRTSAHNKTLISKTSQLNNRDFLIRMLFKDSY